MTTTTAMIAIAAALLPLAAVPAGAMPAGPKSEIANSSVVPVAQGCGRGWHRTIYGACVRNLTPIWPCWWSKDARGKWFLTCH